MSVVSLSEKEVRLLSVVIPARDEEDSIQSTVRNLHKELKTAGIPHEIIVVDDGSRDNTWAVLDRAVGEVFVLKPILNTGPFGFGRAITRGFDRIEGDAVVLMMADGSDDSGDVVRYCMELKRGYDCVFGSRFIQGASVKDYPGFKLFINRTANIFLKYFFGFQFNDTTNAFKAYRREVISGCSPLISADFSITVELPLKAFVRGYSWSVIPVSWNNRKSGESKLRIKEMGSRYLAACVYVWIEKYLSRGVIILPRYGGCRTGHTR